MLQRVISALLAAPLVLLAAYFGGPVFLLLLLLIAVLAWLELQHLVQQPVAAYRALGSVLLALAVLSAWLSPELVMPVFSFSLLALLIVQLFSYDETKWPAAALAISSFFYLGLPLVHLLLLRQEAGDWRFVLLLLLTTWGYDTFALFSGMQFGKVRPWAKISPKKSVEGMVGGFVGSIAMSLAVIRLIRPGLFTATWLAYSLLLGVAVGLLAHFGDLTESAIKRSYHVKDSGHFLPGHGGLLDRLDSVLFAAIFVYYFAKYLLL